ncbi:MAG: hypothetical protein ACI4T2_00330 [Christensenellales bacterium]
MNVKLNDKELNKLFKEVLKETNNMEESLMFNLYEDEDCYSMEATFDDEEYVICRDNPAILCSNSIDYEQVLKAVHDKIELFVKQNEKKLKMANEISYGFVDGDLYYIREE